jgi:hypothetical protein
MLLLVDWCLVLVVAVAVDLMEPAVYVFNRLIIAAVGEDATASQRASRVCVLARKAPARLSWTGLAWPL